MLTKLMGLLVINSLDYIFALLQTKPNHEFVIMTEASFELLSHDDCWITDHLPMSLVLLKPLKSSGYGSRNPLQPPMQFVLRPNTEPHTRSGVSANMCVCSPWRAVSVYVEWGGTCVTAPCLAAASAGGSGVLFCNGFSRQNKEWEGDAEGERGEGRGERLISSNSSTLQRAFTQKHVIQSLSE